MAKALPPSYTAQNRECARAVLLSPGRYPPGSLGYQWAVRVLGESLARETIGAARREYYPPANRPCPVSSRR